MMRGWACCLVWFWCSWALAAPVQAQACENPRALHVALIPQRDMATLLMQYRPLMQALSVALGRPVDAVPASSYGAVIEGLLSGAVDLAELGPASYAIAMSRGADIEPIATFRLRTGFLTRQPNGYRSVLITLHGDRPKTLASLRGATLSLTDPASTSGAVLPRQAMRQQLGMSIESYFSRVTYAGSHARALEALRAGAVDAAFVASTVVDDEIRRGRWRADDIDVLWQSSPIPYDPFVIRRTLCPDVQRKILQVFSGNTASLQKMFSELGMEGFASVSASDYQAIRALYPDHP